MNKTAVLKRRFKRIRISGFKISSSVQFLGSQVQFLGAVFAAPLWQLVGLCLCTTTYCFSSRLI